MDIGKTGLIPTIMSNSTAQWFPLYTKPGCEKKVANILSRKNIEAYCPLKRHWNGKKMVALEPLFDSYVFVKIAETEMKKVRMIDGVLNFIYWLGKPAVIREEEIEMIQRFLNEYSDVKLEKVPFNVEGMVRVIGGREERYKAHKIAMKNNEVSILLPSLGYTMLAEIGNNPTVKLLPAKNQLQSIFEKYQYNFKHILSFQ